VKAAHDDAMKLMKAKQFDQALVRAGKCLELEPENAKCHMLLGACYARLNKQELAAKHYREFLRLAPDHPTSPKIRELLRHYDSR
jgi:Flp pilus assembly protein TadD